LFRLTVPYWFNRDSVTSRSIDPDMQISRIRLSDKTSRLHPRHVVPKRSQADEPEVPVQVREWIGPALAAPDLVLDAQPPAQPHSGVVVDRSVRFGDGRPIRAACGSTSAPSLWSLAKSPIEQSARECCPPRA